ncbi:DUF58 domain-containing protein [Actinocatenispora rupis]|uniref:DUF58 domain-containing protein n=1 Tax=Actinocatenispora rupis TaxID=519421 RepID=UPI003571026E
MRAPDEDSPVYDWVPTRALRRAVGVLLVLLIAGAVLGRVDLVVLATPFALGTAWGLSRRPRLLPTAELVVHGDVAGEGGTITGRVAVDNPDRAPLTSVTVRTRRSEWLRFAHGTGTYVTTVAGHGGTDVLLRGRALRWGRHRIGPVDVRAYAADGLLRSRPVRVPGHPVRVYPVSYPFDAADAMPKAAGIAGTHRSRRPGEGGELAGVRPYQPGDRLRRVDWRVSLRNRELYVNATLSERDAEVVLVLDVLHEAGRSRPGQPSVLDTVVRATASIGEHYLHRGDRVSTLEYGPAMRFLRPATGHRQYLTMLEWLLDVRVLAAGATPTSRLLSHRTLPPNALVLFLTPLLDDNSATVLAAMARAGRFVLAVDCLPDGVRPDRVSEWTDLAYRVWRMERENLVGRLREVGVPVVPWRGTGSLDEVLRDVTRMAAAPRAVLR